jgi:hypothetical protein
MKAGNGFDLEVVELNCTPVYLPSAVTDSAGQLYIRAIQFDDVPYHSELTDAD